MRRNHQQLVFVGTGQITRQEMELRIAQAADVGRFAAGLVDHIIEHDEVGMPFFPGEGIRTELGAEAFQRAGIIAGIEVDIVIAGGIQTRNPELPVGLLDSGQQGQIIMHDVAERDAQGRRRIGTQRRDDVAGIVIQIDGRFRLRITEHQNRKRAFRLLRKRLQSERFAGGIGTQHAAILQSSGSTGLIGEKIRQSIRTHRQGIPGRLDHEQGFPGTGGQAISAITAAEDDVRAIGNADPGHSAFAGIVNAIAVGIEEHPAVAVRGQQRREYRHCRCQKHSGAHITERPAPPSATRHARSDRPCVGLRHPWRDHPA